MHRVMPVASGKESCQMIRGWETNSRKRTIIIAVTANIWESKQSLIENGFDGVIYKPILIPVLRDEIEKVHRKLPDHIVLESILQEN